MIVAADDEFDEQRQMIAAVVGVRQMSVFIDVGEVRR